MITSKSPINQKRYAAHQLCKYSKMEEDCPNLIYNTYTMQFALQVINLDFMGSLHKFWKIMRDKHPEIGSTILKFHTPRNENDAYAPAAIAAVTDTVDTCKGYMIPDEMYGKKENVQNQETPEPKQNTAQADKETKQEVEEKEIKNALMQRRSDEYKDPGGKYFTEDNPTWYGNQEAISKYALANNRSQLDESAKFKLRVPSFEEFIK